MQYMNFANPKLIDIDFFIECVKPLLEFEPLGRMDGFIHHGRTTRLKHSLAVAFYSYAFFRLMRIKCDEAALVRGALLHDFFLYDWHVPDKSHRWHGYTHPRTALENAKKHFNLTKKEEDIILKHMWPLTWRLPRCREALIVCIADKICTVFEILEFIHGYRLYTTVPALAE
ncbi:MAG: HD domain-containing protein [Clostridiales bacterium]|jgi:uncharacterized protein|nr:HD domain-containing protein [Clostridiales bacterium]HOB37393.1 HD domain-containing protein [Candidatus Avimonas sp.]HQD38857.1 HD domain-containing protein [Candidatus Avimonas sp.]